MPKLTKIFGIWLASLLFSTGGISAVYANPTGGNVTSGSASISSSGSTTTINQASQQAIINWNTFNISQGETTRFKQPTNGMTLNRINPNMGASQIYGNLFANGQIILVNGAGIYFGPTAMVNVGSLIASTSGITNENFRNHKYIFNMASKLAGSIINAGTIKTADYGLVALLGTGVVNSGVIKANLGSIVLGAGSKFTLDFAGDELINFAVDKGAKTAGRDQNGKALKNGVLNTGVLSQAGQIYVSAKVAQGVLDNVIDMRGVAQTRSVSQTETGQIILSAGKGNVVVSGKLNASNKHGKGGTIEVLGNNIVLTSTAQLLATGSTGGGNVYVGGNEHGTGPLQNALSTTVDAGAIINASAIFSGNGGNVIVWSNDTTTFAGTILAEGGANSGNGGFSEVSGHRLLNFDNGIVNLSAAHGSFGNLLLDPENVTVQTAGSSSDPISGGTFDPTVDDSILTVADLEAALALASVTVTTGSTGSQAGDITVANNVSWSAATSLTLTAADVINLNANISGTNSSAGITLNAPNGVLVGGGAVTLTAGNSININATIDDGNAVNGTINYNTPGTDSLTLQSHANTLIGNVGVNSALASLTLSDAAGGGTGSDVLNASNISTTGDQTYKNALTINNSAGNFFTMTAANLHIDNASGLNTTNSFMSISFDLSGTTSNINSGATSSILSYGQVGGTLQLNGANFLSGTRSYNLINGTLIIGNSETLDGGSLTVDSGTTLELNSNLDDDGASMTINMFGAELLSNGSNVINSHVFFEMNGDSSFTTTNSNDHLTVNGNLAQDLSFSSASVNGPGTVSFSGTFVPITINSGSTVIATGQFDGGTVNSGATLILSGTNDGNLSLSGTGTNGAGALLASGNAAEISGSTVTLADDTTIAALTTNDKLTFDNGASISGMAGTENLTLSGLGTIILPTIGSVGSVSATVSHLTIGGNINSNGAVSFGEPVTIANSPTINASSIAFASTISWNDSSTLDLISTSNIYLNGDITAAAGTLILSAGSPSDLITSGSSGSPSATGVNVNINLANFTLSQGTFNEISSSLPQFNISNDFTLDPGNSLPSSNISFTRAAGGTGTTGNPYILTDAYGLEGIGSSAATLADSYELANDIDTGSTGNWNQTDGFEPIGSQSTQFTGNLNGNYFNIKNLTIFSNTNLNPNTTDVGLFAYVNGGEISNLGLTNESITSFSSNAGGIAANANNETFANVFTTGSVNASQYAGGIVGSASNVTISGSYSTDNVESNFLAGGIAGNFGNGSMTNSYFAGFLQSSDGVGGFFGSVGGTIHVTNSYSNATFDPGNNTITDGALFGYENPANFTLTNVYWNSSNTSLGYLSAAASTGSTISATSVTGESLATLKTIGGYSGFSFGSAVGDWTLPSGSTASLVFPQVLSGVVSGAGSGDTVDIYQNGILLDAATTNSSGMFSYNATGLVSGADLLFVLATSGLYSNGMTFAPSSGSNLSISMSLNSLTVGDTNANTISIANLGQALVGVTPSSSILYSVSGNDLTLVNTSGSPSTVNFNTTANTILQAGNISYGSNTSGNLTFNGAVQVQSTGTPTTTFTTAGSITLNSTVDGTSSGAQDFALAAANVNLNGNIGGTTPLASLTITDASGGNSGAVIIGNNSGASVSVTAENFITIDSTIDDAVTGGGVNSLTLMSNVNTLNGNVGSSNRLANLTLSDPSGSGNGFGDFIGGTIVDADNQTYNNPVNLTGVSTAFTSTSSSGNITFNNSIDGGSALTITTNSSGSGVTFNGSLGNNSSLSSLDIEGGPETFSNNANVVQTSGDQIFNGTSLTLNTSISLNYGGTNSSINGNMNANSNFISFNGLGTLTLNNTDSDHELNVSLSGGTLVINNSNALGSDPGINISSDSTLVIDQDFTLSTGTQSSISNQGTILLNANLDLDSVSMTINNLIQTSGTYSITGSADIGQGNFEVDGTGNLTVGVSAFNINKSGTGTLTIGSGVYQTGSNTINAGTLELTDTGNVSGSSFTVDSGALLKFDGSVSGVTLNLSGTGISNSGPVTFSEMDSSTINLNTDVTINGAVTLGSGSGTDNTVNGAHTLTFSGDVSLNANINSDLTPTLVFQSPVSVGSDSTITAKAITFGSTVDDANVDNDSLTLQADTINLNGSLGGSGQFENITISDAANDGTSGAVNINSDTTISANSLLISSTIDDATSGAHALTLKGFNIGLHASIGSTTALKSISILDASNGTNASVAIGGNGNNISLTASDSISVGGTMGDNNSPNHSLSLASQLVTLYGDIGNPSNFSDISITDATGGTTGGLLIANSNLSIVAVNSISISSTIDDANSAGSDSLGIYSNANTLLSNVGSTAALNSIFLSTGGPGNPNSPGNDVISASSIHTTGNQDYQSNTTFNNSVSLLSDSGGTISFGSNSNVVSNVYTDTVFSGATTHVTASGVNYYSLVDGATALTSEADSNGNSIYASFGSVTPLTSIDFVHTGQTDQLFVGNLSNSNINYLFKTTGDQTYNNNLTFQDNSGGANPTSSVTYTAANVHFNSNMTIECEPCTVDLTLNISGTTSNSDGISGLPTLRNFTQNGGTFTTGELDFVSGASGVLTVNNGIFNLTGTETLSGVDLTLNNAAFNSTGILQIQQSLNIIGTSSLSTALNTDTVEVSGNVNGDGSNGGNLTVSGPGSFQFDNGIGAASTLGTFTANAAVIYDNGASQAITAGAQNYNSSVTVSGVSFAFTGSAVNFNSGSSLILTNGSVGGGSNLTFSGGASIVATGNNSITGIDVLIGSGSSTISATNNVDTLEIGSIDGTASTPGSVEFSGAGFISVDNSIGGNNALNSLSLDSGTTLNAGATSDTSVINTIGNQNYSGTLNTITTPMGSAGELDLITGSGTINFESGSALTSLSGGLFITIKLEGNANIASDNSAGLDQQAIVEIASGTTQLNNSNGFGSAHVIVDSGTTLVLNTDIATSVAAIDGAGTISVPNNSSVSIVNSIESGGLGFSGTYAIGTNSLLDIQTGVESGFTKAGAGILKLSASNVSVEFNNIDDQAGTLLISGQGFSMDPSTTLSVDSGAILSFLDGVNPIAKIILNGGTISNTGTNTFTGSLTLVDGTSSTINVASGGNFEITGAVAGVSGNTGNLELSGSGGVQFDSSIGINSIIEDANVPLTFSSGVATVTTAGTQDYNGTVNIDGSLAFASTGSSITFESASNIAASGQDVTFTGTVNLDGTGTFANVNLGDGTTATTINYNNSAALDTGNIINLKSNATLNLGADFTSGYSTFNLDSGSILKTSGTHTFSGGGILSAAGGTIEVDSSGSLSITDETMGSFSKTGTGTLSLSQLNSANSITISAGTLSLVNNVNNSPTGATFTVASGATLNIANFTTGDFTVDLNGSGASGSAGALTSTGNSELDNTTINLESTSIIGSASGSNTLVFGSGTSILAAASSNAGLTINSPNAAVALPYIDLTDGGSGGLSVTAGGAITQNDLLLVSGASSFTAGANAITLDYTGAGVINTGATGNNLSGTVSVSNSGTNDISIINNVGLNLGTVSGGQNISFQTSSGNITVGSAITLTSANTLNLNSAANIAINASIEGTGNTSLGSLVLNAGNTAQSITASGAINVSNFTLNAGQWYQLGTLPNFTAENTFNIGLNNFTRFAGGDGSTGSPFIVDDIYGLQGLTNSYNNSSTTTAFNYIMGQDIDASVTQNWTNGFVPISFLVGNFNGNNHTISNLTITDNTNQPYVGLFRRIESSMAFTGTPELENLGLINPNITGGNIVGGFVGINQGTISDVYVSGGSIGVLAGQPGTGIGGIVGENLGIIVSSYNSGTSVSGLDTVGGLVGAQLSQTSPGALAASITLSYSTGNVTGLTNSTGSIGGFIGTLYNGVIDQSFSTGNVVINGGTGGGPAGGFVGTMGNTSFAIGGTITNSYSTGSVTGASIDTIGGFVGSVLEGSSVSTSYSAGVISAAGATSVGGFVGTDDGTGVYSDDYFDKTQAATSTPVGSGSSGTGIIGWTTSQMKDFNNLTGFDFSNIWAFTQDTSVNGGYAVLMALTPGPYKPSGNGLTITGQVIGGNDDSISFFLNGVSIGSIVTDSSGNYSFNALSLTSGGDILAYLTAGGLGSAVTIAATSSSSITGLNIKLNTVDIGDSGTNSFNNAILTTALGSLSSSLSLFSASGNNLTLNSGVGLFTTATSTFTVNGNISASGNIQFSGASTIIGSAATVSTSNGTINANAIDGAFALALSSTGGTTIAGAVGGVNPLSSIDITGPASIENVTTTGSQNYRGAVTLEAATTLDSTGGGSISLPAVNGAGFGLTFETAGSASITGIFSGTGSSLTQAGAGTLTLSAANTYTGGTTISAGTVSVTNATGLGTAGVSIAVGSILDVSGGITVANAISDSGEISDIGSSGIDTLSGAITLGASAQISAASGSTLDFSNTITGAQALTLSGTGTINLANTVNVSSLSSTVSHLGIGASITTTGTQSYGNAVTVTGTDTLTTTNSAVNFSGTVGGSGALTVASGTGLDTFTGAVSGLSSLSSTGSGGASFGAGASAGSVSVTGATSLTGNVTTTGAQTFTGALSLNSDATLQSSSSGIISLGAVTGNGHGLTINTAGSSSISGIFGGTGSTLTQAGSGTLTLSNTNTYTGGTTISSGTVSVTNSSGLGTGAASIAAGAILDISGGITLANVLNLSGEISDISSSGTDTLSGAITLGAAAIINASTGSTLDVGNTINGAFALSLTGLGTINLQDIVNIASVTDSASILGIGANITTTNGQSYTGAVVLDASTILESTSSGAISLAGITGAGFGLTLDTAGTSAITGIFSGTGSSLTQSGAGTLTLSNANTYTGGTTISAGTVSITNATGLGTAAVSIAAGSVLDVSGSITVANAISNSGEISDISSSGTDTLTGVITLGGAAQINAATGATLAVSNTITGAQALTLSGAGTINLGNTVNTSSVGSTVSHLGIGASITTTGTQTYANAVTLTGTDTLTTTNSIVTFSGTLSGAGALTVASGTGLDTFTGAVSGLSSLSSTGSGGASFGAGVSAGSVSVTGATSLTGNVTTTGAQTFTGALTLHSASTLQSTGSGIISLSAVSGGGFGLTINTAGTSSISGILSGTGSSLTVTGGTALTLGGANTYTGGTTITNGSVTISTNTGLGTSAATFASGTSLNVSNGITVANAITLNGTAAINDIDSSGTDTFSNTITLGSSSTPSFNAASGSTLSFTNTISGPGQLSLAGAGTINLGTVSGVTSIASTVSNLGIGGSITTTGTQSYGNAVTVSETDTLSTTNSIVTFSGTLGGTGALTVASGTGLDTFTGAVSGLSSLSSTGSGGALFGAGISVGSVSVTGATALTGNVTTTGAQTFTGALSLNSDATLQSTSSGVISLAAVTGNGHGLTINTAGSSSISGIFSGTGSTLTQAGSGTLTLSGVNTYTGGANINSGTVSITKSSGLGTGAASIAAGAILDISGGITVANLISLSGAINDISSSGTDTLSNAITLGAAAIINAGAGATLDVGNTISGAFALSLTGTGTINLQNLVSIASLADSASSTGIGANVTTTNGQSYTGGVILDASTTLESSSSGSISLAGITGGGFGLTIDTAGSSSITGVFSGTGSSLTQAGTGTLTLSNANTYTGGTTISSGVISATHSQALGTTAVLVDSGAALDVSGSITLANALTLNGTGISNTGALNDISSSGADTVSGAITLGSATQINAGSGSTLNITNTITGPFSLTLTGAGTINIGNTVNTNSLTSSVTSLGLGAGVTTVNGQSYTGAVNLNAAATLASTSSGAITLAGITGNGFGLTINTGGSSSISGIFSGTGSSLTKAGSGTLALNAANTYTGATIINVGILTTGIANAISSSSAVSVNGSSNFNLNNFSQSIGSLTGASTSTVSLGSATLTTGSDNTSTTYAGTISGIAGSLSKTGSGNFTLSGTNSYSGTTEIQQGTLTITNAGAISSSTLQVDSGGTFGLGVDTTLNGLTGSGGVSINSGITLTVNVSGADSYNGILSGAGNLIVDGTGTLTLTAVNTYTGTTTINTGTVKVGVNNALSSSTNISLAAGATLDLNGFSDNVASVSGAGILNVGTGVLEVSPTTAISTPFSGTLTGSGEFLFNGSGSMILSDTGSFNGSSTISNGTLFLASALALGTSSVNVTGGTLSLTSVDIANGITLSGGTLNATGNSGVSTGVTVAAASTISTTSSADDFVLTGDVDGAATVAIQGPGTVELAGASNSLGGVTSSTGSTTKIDNGVQTTGSQTYNGAVVLGGDVALTTTGASGIALNAGVSGAHNLSISGSANTAVALAGALSVNNITVTGGGSSNSLTVNTNDVQGWNITGSNVGNITGITEESGTFSFSNIQNVTGSHNGDLFNISAAGAAINSITGGGGSSTIYGSANTTTWNITGMNSGNVTGVNSFSNIQNLVGNNTTTNNFIFANNAGLSGIINASGTNNTIDYSAYGAQMTVVITAEGVGASYNSSGTLIGAFNNIQTLTSNGHSVLDVSTSTSNTVTFTGANSGFVNDPTNFNGFSVIGNSGSGATTVVFAPGTTVVFTSPTTAIVNGQTVTFNNVSSFSGSYSAFVPASSSSNDNFNGTVVNGTDVVNVITSPSQAQNGNGNGNNNDNGTGITGLPPQFTIGVMVANMLQELSDQEQQTDVQITEDQKFSNCTAVSTSN